MTDEEICYICFIKNDNFQSCPYSNKHKWCIDCSLKIKKKCPFCRYQLINRTGSDSDSDSNTHYVILSPPSVFRRSYPPFPTRRRSLLFRENEYQNDNDNKEDN